MRPNRACNPETVETLPAESVWIRPWADPAIDPPRSSPRSPRVDPGRSGIPEPGAWGRPAGPDGRGDDGALPLRFVVRRWLDPLVEGHGFPVHSPYVETVFLPILGPSTTLCLRRLGAWVTALPAGVTIELAELAHDLGLGRGVGRHSPIVRTVDRLCRFGMSGWEGRDLAVRTAVAPATERQLARLSPRIVAAHRAMVASLGSARRVTPDHP